MPADGTRPTWLRPVAIAGVTAVHATVLLWMVWPTPSETALTAPLSVSVVPQGEPSQPSIAADGQPVAEVQPAESQSVESRLSETPEEVRHARIDEQKPIETAKPVTEVQAVEERPIEETPVARETEAKEQVSVAVTSILTEVIRPVESVSDVLPTTVREINPQQVQAAADPKAESEKPVSDELPAVDIGEPSDPVSERVPETAPASSRETASIAPATRAAEAVSKPAETSETSRLEPLAALANRPPEAAAVHSFDEAAAIATGQGAASISPEPEASVTNSVEQPAVANAATPADEPPRAVGDEARAVIPTSQPAVPVRAIAVREASGTLEVQADKRPTKDAPPAAAPPTMREVHPATEAKAVATAARPVEAHDNRRQPRQPVGPAPAAKTAKPNRAEDTSRSAASRASSRAAPASARASVAAPAGAAAVANYRSLVVAELNRRKFYPPSAREVGTEGVVVVSFTIGGSGRITQHAITRASGHAILDNAVHQMMTQVELPPPPGGTFRAMVPIRFNLAH